jgi:hypothetical protein
MLLAFHSQHMAFMAKKTSQKSQKTSVFLSRKKGMALVMTMILVPILLGLGASFVDPIMRSYKSAASDQKTVLAKNVAENLFELALEDTRDLGVGDDDASGIIEIKHDYGTGNGQWWVFGSPELDDEHTFEITGPTDRWYTIPAAGSGNAGGDYCSTSDPAVTIGEIDLKLENLGVSTTIPSDTVTFGTPRDPFEWPCHWNKLYEGQTVSIPLYVDELGEIWNPEKLGLNEFELRIRTACDPDVASGDNDIYKNAICESTQRYELDGDVGFGDTTLIVLWEIVAEEIDGGGVSTGRTIALSPFSPDSSTDSNIQIENINGYITNALENLKNNSVTKDNETPFACDWSFIEGHLLNTAGCMHQDINKPILNFTLIHTLIATDTDNIPYLEYQFRTPVVAPNPSIASNEKLIRTEVMLDGGYSETIEKSIDLTKPVTGFVIQQ